MAISLQLSVFATALCFALQPRRILDLGSGFSSVAFRLYSQHVVRSPEVWSVDDSPQWLEKTRRFVSYHGLPIGEFLLWDSLASSRTTFDLVLHDLGGIELRTSSFERVLSMVNADGHLIVDDAHFWRYQQYVRKLLKSTVFGCYSLRYFTVDRYGRYALLVRNRIPAVRAVEVMKQ
jgi:hypothetical protein